MHLEEHEQHLLDVLDRDKFKDMTSGTCREQGVRVDNRAQGKARQG